MGGDGEAPGEVIDLTASAGEVEEVEVVDVVERPDRERLVERLREELGIASQRIRVMRITTSGPITDRVRLRLVQNGEALPDKVVVGEEARTWRSLITSGREVAISNLHQRQVDVVVNEEAGERCMVCLCQQGGWEEVAELRCRHSFHAACLARWLAEGRSTCPVCRAHVARRR